MINDYKRGGKAKRKKRKRTKTGSQVPQDAYHNDFSMVNNVPVDTSPIQYGIGGVIGGALKGLGKFAGFIPGVGTLVGAGTGLLGSALESTDKDSATGGKFDVNDFLQSGISGALGGIGGPAGAMSGMMGGGAFNPLAMMGMMGGGNPLMVGAGQNTFAYGGQTPITTIEVEGNGKQQGTGLQMKRGELLTRDGKVLRNFIAGSRHKDGGLVTDVPEGTMIIPINRSEEYLNKGQGDRRRMELSIKSQQDRREEEINTMMAEIPSKKQKNPGVAAYAKGGWIQDAVASIKRRGTEGKCTPITKPGCTGRARALAKTFKKMARNRELGGTPETMLQPYAYGGRAKRRMYSYQDGGNPPRGTFREGDYYTGDPQMQGVDRNQMILNNLGLNGANLSPEEVNMLKNSYGYTGEAGSFPPTGGDMGTLNTNVNIGPTGIGTTGPGTGKSLPTTTGGTFPTGIGRASNPNLFGNTSSPAATQAAPGTNAPGKSFGDYAYGIAELAPIVGNAIDYFQKPTQLNAKDYEVSGVGYHDMNFNKEPYRRASASAAYSLRNAYSSNPAGYMGARTALAGDMASRESDAYNQLQNQNAQNRIGVDATNLQNSQMNMNRKYNVTMFNEQAKAKRRDAGRAALEGISKYSQDKRNTDVYLDHLAGAYGDLPGYQDRVDRTRRRYNLFSK